MRLFSPLEDKIAVEVRPFTLRTKNEALLIKKLVNDGMKNKEHIKS